MAAGRWTPTNARSPRFLSLWDANGAEPSTSFSAHGAAVLGNVRHAHLVRCLFGKTRRRHRRAPNAGMRCGLPASSRQCSRCLGWSFTYADGADTSEPPNASPIPHHRSGSDRRAAYDIPCSVPALANANDPDMDDQPNGAHEARQATALARPQAARGSAVSVHRLRACRYDRVARVRR